MNTPLSRTLSRIEAPENISRHGLRERLLLYWLEQLVFGQLTVTFPSGAHRLFKGPRPGPHATLQIKDFAAVTRTLLKGDLGFAEAYVAGQIETSDLSGLVKLGAMNETALSSALGAGRLAKVLNRVRHGFRANTRRGSRRNIAAHYDLGNDFYGLWLDETMTYSSALFDRLDEDMVTAQRRKYLRLAEKLNLQPGDEVLEIGCGWGGFAEIAAREFGCRVVCLTLSQEQAAFARQRMARAGLSDQVEIRLQDYREVTGRFDKVASIEMFEAVGEAYWPVYLNKLRELLSPGGKAALQIITIDDGKFEGYRDNPDFIQRYIFPGGMLPSPDAFNRAVDQSGLQVTDRFFFGSSYAETMRRWDQAFDCNWNEIEKLGFDERFYRMWRYYMAYCEAGFETGNIDVGQFVLEKT